MNTDGQWITMLTAAIGNYGFPIAISIYLLLSFQRKMDELSQTVNDLKHRLKDEGRN